VTTEPSSTYRAVMDVDKTIMVATAGDQFAGTSLSVSIKPAQELSVSDVAGAWESNALNLVSGAEAQWQRSRFTLQLDGSCSWSATESDGGVKNATGTWEIAPGSIVTVFLDGGMAEGYALGGVDAGKTILASIGPDTNDQETWFVVMVKMADAYSPSDLVGVWEGNSLFTGPNMDEIIGHSWRKRLTIAADGTLTGTTSYPNGESGSIDSGTISISSDGVVTVAGLTWFRGVMDAGKTIIVTTETHSGGEDVGLTVLTRVE